MSSANTEICSDFFFLLIVLLKSFAPVLGQIGLLIAGSLKMHLFQARGGRQSAWFIISYKLLKDWKWWKKKSVCDRGVGFASLSNSWSGKCTLFKGIFTFIPFMGTDTLYGKSPYLLIEFIILIFFSGLRTGGL